MVPAHRSAPSGSVALLRFARDTARASRPCPTCRAFCTLPPRILRAIIQRGLWSVNLPPRSQGAAKTEPRRSRGLVYLCAESSIGDRGVRQKTRRLDIPAVHPDRRGLLLAGGLRPATQRRAADV